VRMLRCFYHLNSILYRLTAGYANIVHGLNVIPKLLNAEKQHCAKSFSQSMVHVVCCKLH